jgi:acyl-coenzyme A thioesterase PaaI-like protein
VSIRLVLLAGLQLTDLDYIPSIQFRPRLVTMSQANHPPPRQQTRTQTSFADAIAVSPIPGTNNHFSANIPWDWCGGTHAHGGYTTSLILSTARAYFLSAYPSRSFPDPINTHVQFLSPASIGPARLCVRELSSGRQYFTIQIELQKAEKDGSFKTCHIAIVTQGNLATEAGMTIETTPTTPKEEIPDREKDCERFKQPAWVLRALSVANKLRTFNVKGGVDGKWSDRHGLGVRECWMGFSDESTRFDVLSLGLLCDFVRALTPSCPSLHGVSNEQQFLSAPTNFFPHMEDLKTITYPTVCLSIEVKKDPMDAKWLFLQIRSHQIKNGRFDQEVRVLDERAELVALSKHVCTAVEMKRRSPGKVTQRVDKL